MTGTILSDRAVLRIGGDEARAFLQGLVTQDVESVTRGVPRWAGLLTPQGKALFDFILWAGDGDDILIDCEADQAAALARRLTLYRLRRAVTIEATGLAVHWAAEGDDGVADPRLPTLGRRRLAEGGYGEAADEAWRSHRLALGVTEGVGELGQDATLWLECNARELNGVSFTKGCYVGQENTARMHHRAKIGRRLVVVRDGEAGPRTRAVYPELGLRIDHRRVDDLEGALLPEWVRYALTADVS